MSKQLSLRDLQDNLQAFCDGVDNGKAWTFRTEELQRHLYWTIEYLRITGNWPKPEERCADAPGQTFIPGLDTTPQSED